MRRAKACKSLAIVCGLNFYLNANMIDPSTATHINEVLQTALRC